eukprot:CAMPEP_0172490588 /NCGR_PEP_ID=MMETSP1066-20121228/21081_1 /TAXON_ID=671091 /ORGANISM="Coscinodiscus wailesii, Strain CCMP2513" /LENGTH=265 /DNA_ID=CAMNT_0013259133 /DNA_START=84 /DNA_END=881 /DNA_ORIENTATION=-
MNNREERVAELKALRREYKGTNNFEFLGPKVPEATRENPTRMKIHKKAGPDEVALTVIVELPEEYPSDASPIFKVEGESLEIAHTDAIRELLDEQASYMPGMACISTSIMALDDLDLSTLDLGEPGRCRSIFKVDVVNNSKQFTKSLKLAASGNPCVYYYRTIECQNNAKFSFAVDPWRAVYCICDTPDKKAAVEYMKTIRTDGAMDMDMLGKPGRIQLTVIEEFEMAPKAKSVGEEGSFNGVEYRTNDDLDGLMNPFLAVSASV